MSDAAESGVGTGSVRVLAAKSTVLQRYPWIRGYLLMLPTLVVMLAMLVAPIIAMVVRSFWTQNVFEIDTTFTMRNYLQIFGLGDKITYWMGIPFPFANPVYLILLVKSILMSLTVTAFVVLLAYPMAYFMAFRVHRRKVLWLILITVPIWTSYLLRVFAWKIMLGFNGVINSSLMKLGLIDQPLEFLLYSPTAVMLTLAHAWVAFAILPIYVSLEKIDRSLLEAATDLGDRPWERFWHITLPLSAPGTIATALMVFIPTVGDYVTPALVGGSGGSMVGNSIQILFGRQNDAPLGSAVSVVMMALVTAVVCLFLWAVGYRKIRAREAA
ncbi:ABC transporter permease [Dongia sp.]|uniref:ABC transporter permease n=1 Tax=Dongia sp. TaxID=1977262 RepID=UPI0035B03ACD